MPEQNALPRWAVLLRELQEEVERERRKKSSDEVAVSAILLATQ